MQSFKEFPFKKKELCVQTFRWNIKVTKSNTTPSKICMYPIYMHYCQFICGKTKQHSMEGKMTTIFLCFVFHFHTLNLRFVLPMRWVSKIIITNRMHWKIYLKEESLFYCFLPAHPSVHRVQTFIWNIKVTPSKIF
jgi:hypothetical protein